MARGRTIFSLWDAAVSDLRLKKSTFRMKKSGKSPWIYIREMQDGRPVREFSSARWLIDENEDIQAAWDACLEAHKLGQWQEPKATRANQNLKKAGVSWENLVDLVRADLRDRIARYGSRKNTEGHLVEIATLTGPVCAAELEAWAKERNPITQPSAFRNRLETLSHINKAGVLEMKPSIERLKALRPTGAAKREQDQRTQQVKAIPTDEALEGWLDGLDGHLQWTLALIATYGLRPSEAWHAEGINEQGWITIPGEGLTKTKRHYAPPVPPAWLERYQLRENFERYQAELNERWKIKWEERGGVLIPTNNPVVSNALYQNVHDHHRLYVGDEWVRPYGLRHSYAIRCEISTEPQMLATPREDFAQWLGHSVEVHERIYLKFIPQDRKLASLMTRHGAQQSPTGEPAGLSDEILAKLAKLEQLEKLLSS